MPLITHTNINSNFIKYKGKIYRKTDNQIVTDLSTVLNVVDGNYETEEQALYGTALTEDIEGVELRPVFSKVDTSTFSVGVTGSKYNTYHLKVVNKESINKWFGQGSSMCFSISGFQNMELNLMESKTYRFNQFDATNLNDRLIITTDPAGLNVVQFYQQQYIGTPGINGALEFTIPVGANKEYYLSSISNRFMGIKINVNRYAETMPSDVTFFDLLSSTYYVPLSTIP